MKYSTPGVSRQRSHKSNSTYIIKLWTSPLNHSTDKSHNTIINEASVGRRIIFSISHKWRRMSTFSILIIYDNLFWWKTILNPDASSHLLFFLILISFWHSDLRRTIWSPYHSGDRSALMWKGQIDFLSIANICYNFIRKFSQQINQQIRKLSSCHYSSTTSAVKNRWFCSTVFSASQVQSFVMRLGSWYYRRRLSKWLLYNF